MRQIFETVSFHIVKPCNAKCKFCYATFNDMHVRMLPIDDASTVIRKLAEAGVQKITFAGGEPLLYPNLSSAIIFAKDIGMTTGIITNGFNLGHTWLTNMRYFLDWVGLSIDSLNPAINRDIGRAVYDMRLDEKYYEEKCQYIKELGYRLKINTVVNAYNVYYHEELARFIAEVKPDRWKILRALRVEGQNDKQFAEIGITDVQFRKYVSATNSLLADTGINPVVENNADMTGSYLLIDPQGRMFENTQGKHNYSDSLVTHSVEHCLSQINLDREAFLNRGGLYNW